MAAKKKTAKKKAGKRGTAAVAEKTDPREPIPPTQANLKATLEAVETGLALLTPPEAPVQGDLVRAFMHIEFARGLSCGHGQEAVRRVDDEFVDRNEFRVTEAYETERLLEDLGIPDLFDRCLKVRDGIAQIYNDQNGVSLDFLREASVSDRNNFFQRVPALDADATHYLSTVVSWEEVLLSDRSTLRVQTRLGLDPKAPAVGAFIEQARALIAKFGHLPLVLGPDPSNGKPIAEPELCPTCLFVRIASGPKGRR